MSYQNHRIFTASAEISKLSLFCSMCPIATFFFPEESYDTKESLDKILELQELHNALKGGRYQIKG